MSAPLLQLTPELYQYLLDVSLREDDTLARLRQFTATLPQARMQISPEQGQFLGFLVQLMGVKKALEIGVFTGYSALAVALVLPADGELVACELNEDYGAIAQKYWQEAGVAGKIQLRLGPAVDTLDGLLAQGQRESFDFVFIDANKSQYVTYYEKALALVRSGGLIVVDNVLWYGRVADPDNGDRLTEHIRRFNQTLTDDPRIDLSLVPIGDGLTLARKR